MTKSIVFAAVLAACGKSGSDTSSNKSSPSKADDKTPMCDRKLVTAADLAGLLPEPLTGTKAVGGDGCEFVTATEAQGGPSVLVRYSASLGKTTVQSFLDGKMGVTAEPLAGVGDSAVWVKDLKEVDAAKGNAMCAVSLGGAAAIMKFGNDLPQKLGAVCTKVFANAGN